MRKIVLFLTLTCLFTNFYGQITTSVNPTIAQMQALLQGNGVVVSGLTITCPLGAYATFNNGSTALGGSLNSGILLTTGTASNVAGPPTGFNSVDNSSAGGGGSALGNTLSGGTTYDGCYITFLITPSCATLSINYVFASEEYPEYATGTINDVFGFVLSGPNPAGGSFNQTNIATLPGTTTPVSIQNVNNGAANAGPCKNCAYYVPDPPGLIYDGKTTVLTASATVTPCQTYTMTIGVWDDSDGVFDSGVFLDVNGLSCANQPSITAAVSPTTVCGAQTVTLTASGGFAIGTYTWSAPPSGGLSTTSGSVVTANPTGPTTYTVKYSDINTCPGFPVTQTVAINFSAPPALPVTQSPAGSICTGQTKTLTANGGAGTYSWSPGTSLSTTSNSVTVASPTITTTYTVTKTVGACISTSVITVTVSPSPTVAITPSLSVICSGQSQSLSASGAGPFAWTASAGANPPGVATVTVSPGSTTSYTVISGTGTCTNSAVATVSISTTPSISITPSVSTICSGQSIGLSSSGTGPFTWTASSGANPPGTASVTVSPAATTTYTVLSGTGACTATAVATVSVSTIPSISITPSLSTVCTGQSQVLTATGSGPFTWTASSGANPPAAANVTVTPASTTSYTVLSGTGTCTATAVATVSVGTPPVISITPSFSTICLGQSVSLSSTGPGPFTWTASNGANPPSAANVTVTPTATTDYTVISGTGTCTSSAVATVSVSPSLSITITPSLSTICVGQSVGLSSSGAGPFAWTASSGANPASAANVTVTPSTTTTYTVLSGTGACTAQAVATVSIATTPSISITPSNTTICPGSSVVLSSTGSAPFIWTASNGTNPPSAASVTVSPSTTTTYTVLSGPGTCTATATATITVTPPASVSITPSLSTICVGQTVTLASSGAGPYAWTASDGSAMPSTGTIAVTPSTTTTYTVLDGAGTCTTTAVATVSIVTTPSISITPSGTIICNGQSATLSVVGGAGPFTWTASNGTTPPAAGTITVTPLTLTTYTVLSGTGTCTASAVATVSVSPTLTITITPSNPSVCSGFGTTLSAGGATSYTWIPGLSTGPTLSVTPSTTSTYTVVGTNSVCVSTATTSVAVITLTTNVSSSSSFYCFGVPPVTLTGSGATTYSWAPGTGLGSTSGAVVTATPAATTVYTVTGTTSGCISTNTISVTVPVTSTITATSSNSVICTGGSSTLTATGANTYTWAPVSVTNDTAIVSPSATTNYTVIGKTANGCFAVPAIITVTVLPVINPLLVAGSPSVCLTKTTTISAVAGSGLTYSWQPVTAIQGASNTSSIIALPPTTATVIYTVTISNGICSATNTAQTTVRTPPVGNFKTLNNDTICTGGCVTFSSTTTGSSPITYKWYYQSGVGTSSVGVAPEACYPSAGSFSVTMVASNNCGIDTVVKGNYIQVYDFPVLVVGGDTTINIGEHAEVTASGGLDYSWSPNVNGTIMCPTCATTIVQPTVTTEYIVVASNSKYCKVQDTVTIIVDVNCGDFFIPNAFSPNDDGLNDLINVHGRCISTFNLQIFNRWGEKVFETSSQSESWDGTFRGQKLDTGVFVYKADGVSIDGQSFKLQGNITLIR